MGALDQLSDSAEVVFDLANLPYCMRLGNSTRDVRIDHGDILAASAGRKAARAWLNLLAAHDLDVSLATLADDTLQQVLAGGRRS